VLLAVNHSGGSDSTGDSTGAVAGNILALMIGAEAIPEPWLAELELREEIAAVARDLSRPRSDPNGGTAWISTSC
jgi:ADP-ribosyl-[dinitrogen reductase] hydrolase